MGGAERKRGMKKRIIKWSDFQVGDLIECRADGVMRTLLVCEKVELDKRTEQNPWHNPLRMAILYQGDERFTLFENDLSRSDDVSLVWEGKKLKKRLDELEV